MYWLTLKCPYLRHATVGKETCENSMVEARWVESGDGVLGEGVCYLPPHQLGGVGSAVISPSRAWGRVPAKIEFNAFWP